MTGQLNLFQGVELAQPEPKTTVKLGRRAAQIPLRKKQQEAAKRLMEILKELEGNDIFIGSYSTGGGHFWIDNLKLSKLRVESFRTERDESVPPPVIVLWGNKGACIRIFADCLLAVREQEYQDYYHYLLDFWNGFGQSPIYSYRSHYACLAITRFKN
ncbi:hypothetical protein DEALK_06560 [Dehalogenimonas alkenigignens]|uniref:Uncharacterized protein n=1 Tax=Dehalogenimonas alkenigignens TaxID=1217799 RepID=A0A0W0GGX4_9CHLR|nr:hypothetical protein [Dehalogenimonas alkenigignens]KTB47811.1 hypothetical protein DEALK_06560 [Dehalogenimonas alkenigignens]